MPIVAWAGFLMLRGLERCVCFGATYADAPFYDPTQFKWLEALEADSAAMKEEALRMLEKFDSLMSLSHLSKYQENVDNDDHWKVFILSGYGMIPRIASEWCPRTVEALHRVNGLSTAVFSILHPGKRIAPHRGLYKGLSRCHLALVVPTDAEACWIRVGDETRHWTQGRTLVFEDTMEHEVWNQTDEFRVVLLITFQRPLRLPFRLMNRGILWLVSKSPYVTDTVHRYREWEDKIIKAEELKAR